MRNAFQVWTALGLLTALFLYISFVLLKTQKPSPRPGTAAPLPLAPAHRNSVTLDDGSVTYHLNLSQYEALFPHLQRYQCREVIADAALCRGPPTPPLLLLAVKSHPASHGRRATLRRTWAQPGEVGGFRLQPVFLMATSFDSRHTNLVQLESKTFGDLIMWDFTESHHNLSLKERCFLRWAHKHCQEAAYIFKGDDDLFVNPSTLAGYLSHMPNASSFIHGHIQHRSAVMRRGKYAVSPSLYALRWYPDFASGGGFVLPHTSVAALYKVSLRVPVFPLDDVYLGLLVLAAGLAYQHDQRFKVWGRTTNQFKEFEDSFTIHGISMEKIEEVWQGLSSHPHRRI